MNRPQHSSALSLKPLLSKIPLCLLVLLGTACSSAPPPAPSYRVPTPEIVKVRVVVRPPAGRLVPEGSRIVITNIDGSCATEVRDALTRRLVDNTDYNVLTREFLEQILFESKQGSAGQFDSTTAVRLGELLAASVFVVGRVAYCGPPSGVADRRNDSGAYNIIAIIQILDLRTGKVLVSSSAEGFYAPTDTRLLISYLEDQAPAEASPLPTPEAAIDSGGPGALRQAWRSTQDRFQGMFATAAQNLKGPEVTTDTVADESSTSASGDRQGNQGSKQSRSGTPKERPVNYRALRAAEDLANKFADKFFSRPMWEDVEMWTSPSWSYGEAIRYVKLGRCPQAVQILESMSPEVEQMREHDIANYLHNFGVALLCNNEPDKAVTKLHSAYRITYDESTLEMIELASKIKEWSLTVELDIQPETELLIDRTGTHQPVQVSANPQ